MNTTERIAKENIKLRNIELTRYPCSFCFNCKRIEVYVTVAKRPTVWCKKYFTEISAPDKCNKALTDSLTDLMGLYNEKI